jgi:hypothetical protein
VTTETKSAKKFNIISRFAIEHFTTKAKESEVEAPNPRLFEAGGLLKFELKIYPNNVYNKIR